MTPASIRPYGSILREQYRRALRSPWFLPVSCALILIAVIAVPPPLRGRNSVLLDRIAACSRETNELRFSCYRSGIETRYATDVRGFAAFLAANEDRLKTVFSQQSGDISYAIFGTNCHTFYHAAGDFIATYSTEDIPTQLSYGPTACTNGFTMGVYKRNALRAGFSLDVLKKFYEACLDGAENQCAHEIGHNLHDKYSYSILKILDDLSWKHYGLRYPESYAYVTLAETNLNSPFEDCKKIMPDESKLAQCFTGIGHNLFLFGEFDPEGFRSVLDECSRVNVAHRDDCYGFLIYRIGINNAAPLFLAHRSDAGRKICEDIVSLIKREDLEYHCYLGIGGGIGLFVDSEYALVKIGDENLPAVKAQLLGFAKLCEESKEQFIDRCFAGLFGTKFLQFYNYLGLYHERIEKILPKLNTAFEVVG